jgi:hypothetical protein
MPTQTEGKSSLKCVTKDLRNIITVIRYFGFYGLFVLWAQFALITPLNPISLGLRKTKLNCSLEVSINSFMHNIRLLPQLITPVESNTFLIKEKISCYLKIVQRSALMLH